MKCETYILYNIYVMNCSEPRIRSSHFFILNIYYYYYYSLVRVFQSILVIFFFLKIIAYSQNLIEFADENLIQILHGQ